MQQSDRRTGRIELRALDCEHLPDARRRFAVPPGLDRGVRVPLGPELGVEFSVPGQPTVVLVDGATCPQLEADVVFVQPDIASADWRRGWHPACYRSSPGALWDCEVSLAGDPGLQLSRAAVGSVTIWLDRGCLELERAGGDAVLYVTVP